MTQKRSLLSNLVHNIIGYTYHLFNLLIVISFFAQTGLKKNDAWIARYLYTKMSIVTQKCHKIQK